MKRFGIYGAATLMGTSLVLALPGAADAQHGARRGGGAGAAPMARPAPMMRSAPVMRQAPMVRSAPIMRSMPRSHVATPRAIQPRMVQPRAVQQRAIRQRHPPAIARTPRIDRAAQERAQTRTERLQLRAQTRQERAAKLQERRLQNAEQRLDRLQARQRDGKRLGHVEQRELRRLQNQQQLRERLQARQQKLSPDRAERRALRVTAQQAQAGRFAAQFRNQALAQRNNLAFNRSAALAARAAWLRRAFPRYVPWFGAVYWPYAYTDLFYYTFWPWAYEPGYFAYVYDDFFDSVFFPDGAPYVDYAQGPYEGPYYARATTGSAPRRDVGRDTVPGRVTQEARQVCTEPDKGVTAWPFERIVQAVRPNAEQKDLLVQMEQASQEAAERLKQACPENVPMTPGGRLEAMTLRLQGTLDAVKLVRPPLEKFYESLTDEQKARFNEIGPDVARNERRDPQIAQQGDCGGEKSGLSSLAIDRIEATVRPTEAQLRALDRLGEALGKAVDTLQKACPTTIATTPVGRMETIQQRLEAMIEAAGVVRPALDDFYASLNNEQKSKFNRLNRTAQAN